MKSFNQFINESLISTELSDEIKKYIYCLVPNIEESDGNIRRFSVHTSSDQGKYNSRQIEVSFLLDHNVKYSDINADFKQVAFLYDLKDIIMEIENVDDVTLSGFYYFGNKVIGEKDGRLKNIKDVSDKFDEVLDNIPNDASDRMIKFWFNIK